MAASGFVVVTGAFGYTGQYIARRLLAGGCRVRTLTNHPRRDNPLIAQAEPVPYNFDRFDALVESLRGATTLYNTYWIRFPHGGQTFEHAVANSKTLFRAAREAGIGKVVHISVSNPAPDSPLPYFKGKSDVEQVLIQSGLRYAIVRPTVIFGREDILINNIAWLLRRFPVFAVPGRGNYKLQPVSVEDTASLALEAAAASKNVTLDAAGPDIFTFEEMVRLIARAIGARARLTHLRPSLALWASWLVGRWVGDVVLTRNELEGLMAGLLVSSAPPAGKKRLGDWLAEHADSVGARYASELNRHFR